MVHQQHHMMHPEITPIQKFVVFPFVSPLYLDGLYVAETAFDFDFDKGETRLGDSKFKTTHCQMRIVFIERVSYSHQTVRDFHSTLCNGMVCFNAHHGHTHEAGLVECWRLIGVLAIYVQLNATSSFREWCWFRMLLLVDLIIFTYHIQ